MSDLIMSKIATVYPVIYCRKWFDALITSHIVGLQAAFYGLQCSGLIQKCIRIGITIFKIFIWGGIWSYIRSEVAFYDSARKAP